MSVSIPRRRLLLLALPILVVGLAPGCGSREEIHTYVVPKEAAAPAAATAEPATVGEPTDRMLAAIVPAGKQTWFFKVVGPLAAVENRADDVDKFFASIRLAEDGRPTWELPAEDWKEEQGSGMRAATIRIPADGKPLELSVIPAMGDVLSNINRWRGQLQLPPASQQQLAEFTREIKAGDATITIVDLRGQFKSSPAMTPPFAGGALGAAGRAAPNSNADLPPGHPPIDGATNIGPPVVADVAAPKFDAPESWQPLPAGGFRKAAFQIGGEQDGALVTVIDFPADAGPMIADPLQNVNRWRREVGMPAIEKPQLDETVEVVQMDGHPASYVSLIPEAAKAGESQADRATLAALVNSGNRIWFFKMTGNPEVVAAQEDQFKNFLKSVRFAADQGAHDGDR